MVNRLVFGLTVVALAGCKSSSQTPGDGGPPDTANDRMVLPEVFIAGDGGGTADARDAADAPPACTGPKCPVVLATDDDPSCCLAVDGTYVYWVSFSGSAWSIMRVAGAGGTPEYFEGSEFIVGDLAIQGDALYWTATDGVFRRDLAAARGSATKIASGRPTPARSRRTATSSTGPALGAPRFGRCRWLVVHRPTSRPASGRWPSPPTARTFIGRIARPRTVRSSWPRSPVERRRCWRRT